MRRKLLLGSLGVGWFLDWRKTFANFVAGLPPGNGEHGSGIMYEIHAIVVLDEVLNVKLFG